MQTLDQRYLRIKQESVQSGHFAVCRQVLRQASESDCEVNYGTITFTAGGFQEIDDD